MSKLYEVHDISVMYGRKDNCVYALNGISLEIEEGESIAIVGTSGAGKSTLLNVLSGLEKVTSGSILLKGQSLSELKEHQLSDIRLCKFGFVFQAFHLISSLSVYDNIVLPAMTAYGKMDKEWFKQLVKTLQIEHRLNHKTNQLSGGEKQRVAIARALINKPEVVFADEPSGNLDSRNGNQVFKLLFDYVKDNKGTLIYVTHDMEKAKLAERIIQISDGVII